PFPCTQYCAALCPRFDLPQSGAHFFCFHGAMSESVTLVQDKDFRFANTFGEGIPVLHADEAPPLGGGTGPTPIQLLAAAVGNCLAASLLFALRKFKNAPEPIRASVESQVGRNEENRLRVQRLKVRLDLGVPAGSLAHA